ncbi:MAG: DNA adenine methylase [Anaerolineae bacterium]|nr:DNA adenine methylase [Anaerolineae bacterium]
MSVPGRTVPDARPFLKWAGGKSRLIVDYEPYLPEMATIRRYIEPFIGSAALFFHLQPPRARLADCNRKLIEVYEVVRDDVDSLIDALQPHKNEKRYYYRIRAQDPRDLDKVARAARIIYMNKTCYNGLYRENQQGKFNVPFGRYKRPRICDKPRLRAASQALQGVELCAADFADAVAGAGEGDFVYFDPPYVPLNATSSFTSYSRFGFDERDHRRLAQAVDDLTARGCRVMLSNSSAPLVYELYDRPAYTLQEIEARRNINSKADGRGPVTELLILNYKP